MLVPLAFSIAFTVPFEGDPLYFVDDPIALDGGKLDAAEADATAIEVEQRAEEPTGARAMKAIVMPGRARFFPTLAEAADEPVKAETLLKSGEDLLLEFDYARAAAAFAESAALLEDDLNPADADLVTRARLLEAEAWAEAKNAAAAKDALRALLVLRPEAAPDPRLLSPAARAVFADALAEQRAAGSGTLEIRSEPSAAVVVDGVERGQSPLSLAGVPVGSHRIRLRAPGYEDARAELVVTVGGHAQHEVRLTPTRLHRALDAALHAEDATAAFAELRAAAHELGIAGITLVGVRGSGASRVVIERRIDVDERSAQAFAHVPSLISHPPGVVDDGSVFGVPASAATLATGPGGSRSHSSPTPAAADDNGALVWGGVVLGAAVVVGAVAAGTVLLWPKPQPEPRLGVVLSL